MSDGILMPVSCAACGWEGEILYVDTGEALGYQCTGCATQHSLPGSNPAGDNAQAAAILAAEVDNHVFEGDLGVAE